MSSFENGITEHQRDAHNRLSREAQQSRVDLITWVKKMIMLAYEKESEYPAAGYLYTEIIGKEFHAADDAYQSHYAMSLRFDSVGRANQDPRLPYETINLFMPISDELWAMYMDGEVSTAEFLLNLELENPEAVIVQRLAGNGSIEKSEIRRVSIGGSIKYELLGGESKPEAEAELDLFINKINEMGNAIPEVKEGKSTVPLWLHRPCDADDKAYIDKLWADLSRFRLVPQKYIQM